MDELSAREQGIVALALGNLEKTIRTLPGRAVRWTPALHAGEVAALRRKLCARHITSDLRLVAGVLPTPSQPDSSGPPDPGTAA